MADRVTDIAAAMDRLDAIEATDDAEALETAEALAAEQLVLAGAILEAWITAHGGVPTTKKKEGFRLLALHRQAARGDPSFNACRESCREAVYRHNLVGATENGEGRLGALRLMTMVVRHLGLFISGKLEVAGLGEFCCASKPLRSGSPKASASQPQLSQGA